MSTPRIPIIAGEIYHVFNRSIARQPIFKTQKDYLRAFELIQYYSYVNPPLRYSQYSHYNRLPIETKEIYFKELQQKSKKQIEIFAYCLMPNHFHFLLKGLSTTGISSFISNLQNGYAKYFNLRHERTGSLFQSRFKAIRIETDEQFVHVARYIHLNPITSYVLREISELETYEWSSFSEYITSNSILTELQPLQKFFKTTEDFKKFTYDQINYQRKLDRIKHLTFE
jgi:putative transposase